jgi:hypothetical protein
MHTRIEIPFTQLQLKPISDWLDDRGYHYVYIANGKVFPFAFIIDNYYFEVDDISIDDLLLFHLTFKGTS